MKGRENWFPCLQVICDFFFFLVALVFVAVFGLSLVAVLRLVTAVASLVVDHGLSCPEACGIFSD